MTLATITHRDLRNRVILTFQMGKFNPSNLSGDLMSEKSCDAMKTRVQKQVANATNVYRQMKDLPKVVKLKTRVRL